MSEPRPLREITEALRRIPSGDPESGHLEADDLLIEALNRLATYATETVDEAEADRLIAAYHAIAKWYA